MGTYVAVLSACAFATPEIMAIDDDTLNLFYAAQPELLGYQRSLYQIRRRKAHILSPECEKLLAAAGEMADSPDRVSSCLLYTSTGAGSSGPAGRRPGRGSACRGPPRR